MWTLVDLFARLLAWLSYLIGVRTRPATQIGRGQTVVIVGGGFAGLTTAHYLLHTTAFSVILIERKEYFEFTPAMLRTWLKPEHRHVIHTRYVDMPRCRHDRMRFVQAEVDRVTDRAVRTKSGEWFRYDRLVLAMGSDYYDRLKPDHDSLTLAGRDAQILSDHARIAAASTINVFGAGLVGVELAAEIAETFPSKKLILRSREPHLLPGFPEKAQSYALRWFESRGVRVILENSVPPNKYVCGEGEIAFNATGLKQVPLAPMFHKSESDDSSSSSSSDLKKVPRSDSSNHSGPDSPVTREMGQQLDWTSHVDERSQLLRITPQLHLLGHEHIFAIGDIMVEDVKKDAPPSERTPKVAYQAEMQAWVIAENMKRQEESRVQWRFPIDIAGTSTSPTLVDCSLGVYDGILIFNDKVITGWLPAFNKFALEFTKRLFLRGWLIGELVWFLVDPISMYAHRAYQTFTRKEKSRTD